jgi:hypothetical protein
MKYANWSLVGAVAVVVLPGCALAEKDGADRFREAIPHRESVVVPGPEGAEARSSTQALGPTSGVQSTGTPSGGPWAKYYGFTREVRDGVNHVTGNVLGLVWIIVHTDPSQVDKDQAIWGPYTDALEPATWRFRIREVAPDEFDYFFEGRPKASTSEGDFVQVISGKGWAKGDPKHGDGFFEIDLDAGRALDPFHYKDESGSVKITHDLPPNITDDLAALPKLIRAEIRPSASDQWFDISSNAHADHTGMLDVEAFADTDDSHATQPEDVQIQSRWRASGAGRADITLTGGDVPAALGVITAVECWGEDFSRSFYSDSVSYQPRVGDAASCAYPDP